MAHKNKLLYSGSSRYGDYKIVDTLYDNRPTRLLYGNDNTPQSGMALDDDPELIFDYNQRFLEIIMSQRPARVLVIGGGVCMLPVGVLRLFPDIAIDVVEIDSLLIELAKDYFDLPADPRLRIHIDDGLRYITSTDQTYDIIIIDAFKGFAVPPHLITHKAAQRYKTALSPNGLVAINIISEYKPHRKSLAHDLVHSFSDSFAHKKLYQSDPSDTPGKEQNMLFVASQQNISLAYLQSEEATLIPKNTQKLH